MTPDTRAVTLHLPLTVQGGLGVAFDRTEVTAVWPDSPAAGLLEPGDHVVAADGRRFHPPPRLWRYLQGVPGTLVTLTVLRDDDLHTVVVRRAFVPGEAAETPGAADGTR